MAKANFIKDCPKSYINIQAIERVYIEDGFIIVGFDSGEERVLKNIVRPDAFLKHYFRQNQDFIKSPVSTEFLRLSSIREVEVKDKDTTLIFHLRSDKKISWVNIPDAEKFISKL